MCSTQRLILICVLGRAGGALLPSVDLMPQLRYFHIASLTNWESQRRHSFTELLKRERSVRLARITPQLVEREGVQYTIMINQLRRFTMGEV